MSGERGAEYIPVIEVGVRLPHCELSTPSSSSSSSSVVVSTIDLPLLTLAYHPHLSLAHSHTSSVATVDERWVLLSSSSSSDERWVEEAEKVVSSFKCVALRLVTILPTPPPSPSPPSSPPPSPSCVQHVVFVDHARQWNELCTRSVKAHHQVKAVLIRPDGHVARVWSQLSR